MLTHESLLAAVPQALASVDIPGWGAKETGKVRDIYRRDKQRLLIVTDRVSAFDRVLGLIPYKGQVLNQLSAWWFEQLGDVARNHVIAIPDPNVTIAHEAQPLPVEVVKQKGGRPDKEVGYKELPKSGDDRPYLTQPGAGVGGAAGVAEGRQNDGSRRQKAIPGPTQPPAQEQNHATKADKQAEHRARRDLFPPQDQSREEDAEQGHCAV